MTYAQRFLEIVHKLGQNGYPLTKVYRRIQNRELFLLAYGKLYANKGALTVGVTPTDTVDAMSIARIDEIIRELETDTY